VPAFLRTLLLAAFWIGDIATFIYLTFFDDYQYTWWNWIIVVPLNGVLATIRPIYWLVIRPLFGA
jgi:hypothetical protein